MSYDRWDVVLSLFPFIERPLIKARPVVVLTTGSFHRETDALVVAMITTAQHGRWSSDHELIDLQPTGLRKPCVVRWKIMTLASALISIRIGHVADVDRTYLRAKLAAVLPLPVGDQ